MPLNFVAYRRLIIYLLIVLRPNVVLVWVFSFKFTPFFIRKTAVLEKGKKTVHNIFHVNNRLRHVQVFDYKENTCCYKK